jgi:hypothetical protein
MDVLALNSSVLLAQLKRVMSFLTLVRLSRTSSLKLVTTTRTAEYLPWRIDSVLMIPIIKASHLEGE